MRIDCLVAVCALSVIAAGCGSDTSIAVENKSTTATKVTVRDATNQHRVDFPELAPGERSAFVVIDWPSYGNVNVDASDNHENGTVNLNEGQRNIIDVYQDGTEPAARLEAP